MSPDGYEIEDWSQKGESLAKWIESQKIPEFETNIFSQIKRQNLQIIKIFPL